MKRPKNPVQYAVVVVIACAAFALCAYQIVNALFFNSVHVGFRSQTSAFSISFGQNWFVFLGALAVYAAGLIAVVLGFRDYHRNQFA